MAKEKVKKEEKIEDPAESESRVEQALKEGPLENKQLLSKVGLEAKELTRVLQRLRRRGKLLVLKGRWALVSTRVCPKCQGKGWVRV